jgi:hypothetical protein
MNLDPFAIVDIFGGFRDPIVKVAATAFIMLSIIFCQKQKLIDNIIKAVAATFTMGSRKPPKISTMAKGSKFIMLAVLLV